MYVTVRSEECDPRVTCNYLATTRSRGILEGRINSRRVSFHFFPTACIFEVSCKTVSDDAATIRLGKVEQTYGLCPVVYRCL